MKRELILLPTALLAGAILTGCGGATVPENGPVPLPSPSITAPPPAQPPADATVITIRDFSYVTPQAVPPGETITVRNEDDVAHTVTAREGGGFDVEIPPLGEATFTAPQQAGSYPFYCEYHPNMTGTLSVG